MCFLALKTLRLTFLFSFIVVSLMACLKQPVALKNACASQEDLNLYCGFSNPEDLAVTPDNQFLIVSEYGGMAPLSEMRYGALSLFNLHSRHKQFLPIHPGDQAWGQSDCQLSDEGIAPHGIDLLQRDDGRWQLAVVNHLPSEQIVLFELQKDNGWYLQQRGCVDAGSFYFNDVALQPDGSFIASHMFEPDTSMLKVLWNIWAKDDTGFVVRWSPGKEFEELMFSSGAFPNGVAIDHSSQRMVVNYNLGDETRMYDMNNGEVLARYVHNSPDNVVIQNGTVWVTNHDHAAVSTLSCKSQPNCFLPFSVNQLALQDLSPVASYVFDGRNFGVGTVGLLVNGSLWIGSYHADRLAERPLNREK